MVVPDLITQFDEIYVNEFERLCKQVQNLVRDRGVAEDVTQDAFVKAWRVRHSYQHTSHPAAWIWRIAQNLAISYLRHTMTINKYKEFFYEKVESEEGFVDDKDLVEILIKELNPRESEIIQLYYFNDLSDTIIAKKMNRTVNTITSVRHGALRKMRQHYRRSHGYRLFY